MIAFITMKQSALFLFLLTGLLFCKAQDTVSVYFETGSAKINDAMALKLNAIASSFDVSELDSVLFVGLADSTGASDFNIKLSEKRARAVARYCSNMIPATIPVTCIARGEANSQMLDDSRRVDVILYFPAEADTVVVRDTTAVESHCYMIDYFLLHRCSVTETAKGKKKYTLIQTYFDVKDTIDYYSGSLNPNGDFVAKKLKWSVVKPKKNMQSDVYYSAKIPVDDYNRFRIFQIKEPPCDSCSEDFPQTKQIQNETTCFQVDRFLMQNLQIRTTPFKPTSVEVRVPRELVNLNEKYFVACSTSDEVKWISKKGRRKANYLYTTLPEYSLRVANITRYMLCCDSYAEPSQCDSSMISIHGASFCNDLMFDLETGCNLLSDSARFYLGLGLNKSFIRSQFYLMAGLDNNYNFFGTLRYRQHFLLMPLSTLNPVYVWQSPGNAAFPLFYSLYAGSELSLFENSGHKNRFEQNFHAGFSICSLEDAILQSLYIQGGVAFDYSGTLEQKIFPYLQCGIQIKLVSSRSK